MRECGRTRTSVRSGYRMVALPSRVWTMSPENHNYRLAAGDESPTPKTAIAMMAMAAAPDAEISIGIEPHYQQSYLDKYVALDPATAAQLRAEIEVPMATADLIPYREFIESRFYREWARPQS